MFSSNENGSRRLENQIAIITGAGSGIGSGVAKAMAAEGVWAVINLPVLAGKKIASAVLTEILEAGRQGITYQADVSQEDQVQQMFADVVPCIRSAW